MVLLRWADAIFIEDGYVNILEAKVRPSPTAVGQLLLYERLFKVTPEFKMYWDWPIKKILLTTMVAWDVVELCSQYNIQYEVFNPLTLEHKVYNRL